MRRLQLPSSECVGISVAIGSSGQALIQATMLKKIANLRLIADRYSREQVLKIAENGFNDGLGEDNMLGRMRKTAGQSRKELPL